MKKFILAAMAAIVMISNVSAAESVMSTNADNGIESLQTQENIIDKMILLLDQYTAAIEQAKTPEEFMMILVEAGMAVSKFDEENEEKINSFEETLTEEQQKKYEDMLIKAMTRFETAIKKKAEQFELVM